MNLWNFLKRKFSRTNGTQDSQKEVTRFVSLAFSLLQGENYLEARGLLLRALQHESKIENPALLTLSASFFYRLTPELFLPNTLRDAGTLA